MAAASPRPTTRERRTSDGEVRVRGGVRVRSIGRCRIWCNHLLLCLASFLIGTAHAPTEALQSSLNSQDNLGVTSLTVMQTAVILSTLFSPALVSVLSAKWTIVAGYSTTCVYIAANFYPTWWTILPATALAGAGFGAMSPAQGRYVTTLAKAYSKTTGDRVEGVASLFHGVFFGCIMAGIVCGGAIAATVMQNHGVLPTTEYLYNATELLSTSPSITANTTTILDEHVGPLVNITVPVPAARFCGIDSCPGTEVASLGPAAKVPKITIYILFSVFLVLSGLGVLTAAVFLQHEATIGGGDDGDGDEGGDENGGRSTPMADPETSANNKGKCAVVVENLFITGKLLANRKMQLLIPMLIHNGIWASFFTSDYSKYYVTCNIGVAMVGYMVLCSGLSQSLSSFLAGAFNKYTGRQPLFLLSILGNAAAIVTLFLWQPSSGDTVAIFVLVAVGSMVFSIANTVISGLMSSVFQSHPGSVFANFYCWRHLGIVVNFATSGHLCTKDKLIMITAFFLLSAGSYIWLEILLRKEDTERKNITAKNNEKDGVDPTSKMLPIETDGITKPQTNSYS